MALVYFGGQLELCHVHRICQVAAGVFNGMLYLMYLMYLTTHAWCAVIWCFWAPVVRIQSACRTNGSPESLFRLPMPSGPGYFASSESQQCIWTSEDTVRNFEL